MTCNDFSEYILHNENSTKVAVPFRKQPHRCWFCSVNFLEVSYAFAHRSQIHTCWDQYIFLVETFVCHETAKMFVVVSGEIQSPNEPEESLPCCFSKAILRVAWIALV